MTAVILDLFGRKSGLSKPEPFAKFADSRRIMFGRFREWIEADQPPEPEAVRDEIKATATIMAQLFELALMDGDR